MKRQKRKYKRRNVMSNPKVQLRIIRLFALLSIFYAGTGWYIGKSTLKRAKAEIAALPLTPAQHQDVKVVLHQHSSTQDQQLAIFTFLTFTILVMGSVMLSHTIGGPIYQLREYLRARTSGQVKPRRIRFRKGDFFFDLADAFNDFQENFGLLKDTAPPDQSKEKPDTKIDGDACTS